MDVSKYKKMIEEISQNVSDLESLDDKDLEDEGIQSLISEIYGSFGNFEGGTEGLSKNEALLEESLNKEEEEGDDDDDDDSGDFESDFKKRTGKDFKDLGDEDMMKEIFGSGSLEKEKRNEDSALTDSIKHNSKY